MDATLPIRKTTTAKGRKRKKMYKKKRRLKGDEKRSHTVSARMNKAELEQLDQLCIPSKCKRGEYLRAAALNSPPPIVPPVNLEKWLELGRMGANINQIAKRLNEGDTIVNHIEELRKLIVETRIELLKAKNNES